MKKLVFLFGVLSLVFVSCNKDNNNDDGTPKEQELPTPEPTPEATGSRTQPTRRTPSSMTVCSRTV